MRRYWLLTSTLYGNWLPGDRRGFVSRVRETRADDPTPSNRREHGVPGTPYDRDMTGLWCYARQHLRGDPVCLTPEQAGVLLLQFLETARYRGWQLLAAAIMPNHVHLVVGVDGNPDPGSLLGDFKEYGSRALNRRFGRPASGTWWTQMGSKRKLPHQAAVAAAVEYVRRQSNALVIWVNSPASANASGTRQGAEYEGYTECDHRNEQTQHPDSHSAP